MRFVKMLNNICRQPGRSQAELDTFNAVLQKMQDKAREMIEQQEVCK